MKLRTADNDRTSVGGQSEKSGRSTGRSAFSPRLEVTRFIRSPDPGLGISRSRTNGKRAMNVLHGQRY
jgi:hypothetical protein